VSSINEEEFSRLLEEIVFKSLEREIPKLWVLSLIVETSVILEVHPKFPFV
jgi:hypothetical protein